MQLITFVVNYVGEPFQTPLLQNQGMLTSVRLSGFGLLFLASGMVPRINEYVQLVSIPGRLRTELLGGTAIVGLLCYVIEHTLRDLFPAKRPPRKGYMGLLHLLPEDVRKKHL
jgi:peptidoglycan biosynthesis protein MviN/MurJ (putative lipid II flippase)